MKRILVILCLILFVQHVHTALLLAVYQKMGLIRLNREQEAILKKDSLMAEKGHIHLQLTCALRYWGKEDYATARHFLNKAIAEENDTAMVYLAEMDYYGYGIEKPDVNAALRNAHKALSLGNTFSYFIIGKNHYDNQEFDKAFNCFKSVPNESPDIRLNYYYMAKCYRYGRGVQPDPEKSLDYFTKANISYMSHWSKKHYHRIKELKDMSIIAQSLKLEPNPELDGEAFLSTTKTDRVSLNLERYGNPNTKSRQDKANYESNASIWLEAAKEQMDAEKTDTDTLIYTETMWELEKTANDAKLKLINAQIESYEQLINSESEKTTPKFQLR